MGGRKEIELKKRVRGSSASTNKTAGGLEK